MKPASLVLVAFALTVILTAAAVFIPPLAAPVINYEARVAVNAPVSAVWNDFTDNEKAVKWMKGLRSKELVSGEPRRAGAKYKLTFVGENGTTELYETLTRVEDQKLYNFTIDSDPLTSAVSVTFSQEGGKTRILQSGSVRGKTFLWTVVFYWLQSSFKSSDEENLQQFKNLVEAEQRER